IQPESIDLLQGDGSFEVVDGDRRASLATSVSMAGVQQPNRQSRCAAAAESDLPRDLRLNLDTKQASPLNRDRGERLCMIKRERQQDLEAISQWREDSILVGRCRNQAEIGDRQ